MSTPSPKKNPFPCKRHKCINVWPPNGKISNKLYFAKLNCILYPSHHLLLFLVTPCLVVAAQPCMEQNPIKKIDC